MPSFFASFIAVALHYVAASSVSELVDRGAEAFQASGACSSTCNLRYITKSLRLFDEAKSGGFPSAELWQRGISLYYADMFETGAKQFRNDVAANPHDTEESVWAFACEAQTLGFDEARKRMLIVANETRPYMSNIFSLFRGDGQVHESDLETWALDPQTPTVEAAYYAFYLGFFEEAKGSKEKAQTWMTRLALSNYAKFSICTVDDYVNCVGVFARVHAQRRGWINTTVKELMNLGEKAFNASKVQLSLQYFDQADECGYDAAINWQRGISLYYLGRFEECAQQFHDNYEVLGKHHDAEESVWALLCEAQTIGFKKAHKQMLLIEDETRPYMEVVYKFFKGDISIDAIEKMTLNSSLEDAYYYMLYIGLWYEAQGHLADAKTWMNRAAQSEYVRMTVGQDVYMGSVAVVHAKVRGWDANVPAAMTVAAQLHKPTDHTISKASFSELTLPTPVLRPGEVLIKIVGASINPFEVREAEAMDGEATFDYPHVNGNDFAGSIAAVGPGVTRLQVGDKVWGLSWFEGAHAEYLSVMEAGVWGACNDTVVEHCDLVGLAPSRISLVESAVMPIVAMTSLYAFQTAKGPWTSADKTVVVLGGSGGIGHLAIQLAKAWGAATVITTCSTSNLAFCRSLGADQVIDYHKDDWHTVVPSRSVDFVYDAATQNGTGALAYAALKDGGYFITLQPWPLANKTVAKSRPSITQRFIALPKAMFTFKDMDLMRDLVDTGKIIPHIQDTFSFAHVGDAFMTQKAGHSVGKNSIVPFNAKRSTVLI